MRTHSSFLATSLIVLIAALGCARQEPVTTNEPPPGTTPAPTVMSDANIAAVVVAANNADIEYARLAESRATNPKVKELAKRMIAEHTGVNQKATDLVTRLQVIPEDNDVSRKLAADAQLKRDELKALSGVAFDRAYIDNEIAYHQAVLDMLDQTLIPSAQNGELRALLESVRPAFVAHLEHAKQVQGTLGQAL